MGRCHISLPCSCGMLQWWGKEVECVLSLCGCYPWINIARVYAEASLEGVGAGEGEFSVLPQVV